MSIQIVLSYLTGYPRVSIVLLGILLISLFSKLIVLEKLDHEQELWSDVQKKLRTVLIQSKIIPGTPFVKPVEELEHVFLDNSDALSIQINPTIINELRALGLDGILICLYLLKYRETYCSIKVIQKHLNIPMTTVYRNIAKLVNFSYI
ncbi:MAG: hypothetical protein ACXAD7_09790, partial [Candidatus Kariarchaeaceae archaeon]